MPCRGLGGDKQKRDIVFVGGGDAGEGIGCAGPGGCATNPEFIGVAVIAVGHKNGATFMSGENGARALLAFAACQCIVERLNRAARNAVNKFDVELF